MDAIVYNQSGKEVGKIALPEYIFGVKWNPDLVHQVATSLLTSVRAPVAHSKGRGEVRGGGKKPWRQKGTGRARHGSIRSPIWVGGGVSHGPANERNFYRKVNAKMKLKALTSVLSAKYRDGEIMFVDDIKLSIPKSKEARSILSSLGSIAGFDGFLKKNKNAARFFLPRKDSAVEKGFRNFGNIAVGELRNINPIDALTYKFLIFAVPEKSIEILKNKFVANRSIRAKFNTEHSSRQSITSSRSQAL